MLKFSPPLSLDIVFDGHRSMSVKDEEGALLVLQQHHRVHLISLTEPGLEKLFAVMDKPFPMLEDLTLRSPDPFFHTRLPETFSAPCLRHLDLYQVGDLFVTEIPVLDSITGLVTLCLRGVPPLSLPVHYLVSCLSVMPQLENLSLGFGNALELRSSSSSLKSHKSDPADLQMVELPKLNKISFRGACAYLEGLMSRIRTPELACFVVTFSRRPTVPLPQLSEFLAATEELRYPISSLAFSGANEDNPTVSITLANSERTAVQFPDVAPFRISFPCRSRLDGQVACAARICTALSPLLSEVERLHLNYHATRWIRGFPEEIPREVWFDVLLPFCNVQKLQVDTAMARELSFALCPEDEAVAEGVLPKLRKLSRPHHHRFEGMLDPFIVARQAAGQPIAKRRRPPNETETEDEEERLGTLEWLLAAELLACDSDEDDEEGISTELDSESELDFESE